MSSWIWKEAERIASHIGDKDHAVFECGYGPSGLPHIGTFAEVARTTMIMRAFKELTGKEARLIVFSDDMDGLRKVPSNVPNREMLQEYIGVPVCEVPNPFGTEHKSFADYNNAKLVEFLTGYGFEFEFMTASSMYKDGFFNSTLIKISPYLDEIKTIITHDYSLERRNSYCPFLPIHKGKVINEVYAWMVKPQGKPEPFMQWFMNERSPDSPFDDRVMVVTPIINGHIKCQWKLDWPMRWIHLGVDYEMHGKDLLGSAQTGHKICKAVGVRPPLTYMYELFLDEEGAKISKSKGNGFEFEEWIRYSPSSSLQWFLYQNPRKSRKLHWDCVPQATDMLIRESDSESNRNDAYWAIWGDDRKLLSPISYTMLLNLVSITDVINPEELLKFVQNYDPSATIEAYPYLAEMIQGVINYYVDHILPTKVYRTPTAEERKVLLDLAAHIEEFSKADEIMFQAYEVGKRHYGEGAELKNFFGMIYEILMGQTSGPRFGQFAEIVGVKMLVDKIRSL